jgi:DNA-binding CsgD family transcriptional regulator
MMGSIRANGTALALSEATPIARLTGEYLVVVVPSTSPARTFNDLVRAFRANPGTISWAASNYGSTDHLLVALIARALGIPSTQVNYFPSPGAGEELKALVAGEVSAGATGYGECAEHVRSGSLRVLAVSSEERLPGVDIPTLKEEGIDIALINWRGVFAAPGISAGERRRLERLLTTLVRQRSWRSAIETHRWMDMFLAGEEFARFVQAEQTRLESGPDMRLAGGTGPYGPASNASLGSIIVGLLVCTGFGLAGFGWRQWSAARRREEALSNDLEQARLEIERSAAWVQGLLSEHGERIERQFDAWGLTSAEREVAILLLKGLRHKEIAQLRSTSERTVRHQALAIYKKAGLDGRTDLAAYFLEERFSKTGSPPGPASQTLAPKRFSPSPAAGGKSS